MRRAATVCAPALTPAIRYWPSDPVVAPSRVPSTSTATCASGPPDRPRPFLTPFYPVTPVLFAIAAGLLVANTLATQTREALIGLTVVALGIPAFFAWRIATRRHPLSPEPPLTELSDASTLS